MAARPSAREFSRGPRRRAGQMANDAQAVGHDAAVVEDGAVDTAVHHGARRGLAVDEHEVGAVADRDARTIADARHPRRGVAHDRCPAHRGDGERELDVVVATEAVDERELPRAVEHVAVAVGAPVVTLAVLAEAHTHPGLDQVDQTQVPRRRGGDGGHCDIQLGELVDEATAHGVRHRAEVVGVRDRDLALHAERTRALEHELGAEDAEGARLVQVDVDLHLVLLGQPEHDVQVPDRVTVELTRIDAAHDVGTLLE